MIVVFDAGGAGISTLKLLKYLPVTLGLNAEYYPESVKSILVITTQHSHHDHHHRQ